MAVRVTYTASVSLEYDYQPVQTVRVEIVAASHIKAASRAVREAIRTFPNARPRSIVVVLEIGERVDVPVQHRPRFPGGVHPRDAAILGGDPSL